MERRYLYILLLSFSVLISCKNSVERFEFTKDQEIHLKKEKIPVDTVMDPSDMILKNGFLVIRSSKTPFSLFLFQPPSLEFVRAEGRKGKGPDEIKDLAAIYTSSNDNLYVEGYTPTTLRKVELGEEGQFNFLETIKIRLPGAINDMSIIGDSVLIYRAEGLQIKKHDLISNKELDYISFPKENHNHPMYYENRGELAANDDYLVYIYCYKKEIDIYDTKTFKLIKKISDGKRYPLPEVGGEKDMIIPLQRSVLLGKDYFYVLGRPDRDRSNPNRYIEVFDYDGKPIVKYLFDNEISLFAVDTENGYIYGYDYSDPDNLLRYDIKRQ